MINKQNTTRFTHGSAAGGPTPGANARKGLDQNFDAQADGKGVGQIWFEVRGRLRAQLNDGSFDNWIAKLELIAEVDEEILLAAPSELDCIKVETKFGHYIREAWRACDPMGRTVSLKARNLISEDVLALVEPAQAPVAPEASPEDAVADGGEIRDVRKTLDSFLVGDSNRGAYGVVRRIADGGEAPSQIVTLVGPHGVGKTHLLQAVFEALQGRRPDGEVLYLSSEDFTVAFVEGVKRKDTSDLRATMRKAKVLILDDLQFFCSKPGTLVEFFAHVRAIAANGGVVIMTCDRSPAVLELEHRMRDEILGGVVVQIDLPDVELRKEIIRSKAAAIAEDDPEFIFPEDWVETVAERLPMSGRALYGVVRNVFVWSRLGEEPLSRSTVEKAVQLQLGGVALRAPKIDTIKDVTARHYGVSKQDLESPCRKRLYAQPRQYAMYLCRKLTSNSYPMIGREFGGRDHTTVLFAFRKIDKMVKEDPSLNEELRQLEQRIRSDPRNFR